MTGPLRTLRGLVPFRAKLVLRQALDRLGRSLRTARLARRRRAGRPAHSLAYPAPPLRPHGRRLEVAHVVLASDLNPRYLDLWPLARRAWSSVARLEPQLVLVANEHEAPDELRRDELVHVFPPLEGLHTAFQAQCVRLLYPALLDSHGAVLVSDIDLLPLSRTFWREAAAALPADTFVAYRDVLHHRRMVAIAYNAAEPGTWADVFGVRTPEDVRRVLGAWGRGLEYEGVRGGAGWYGDQRALHDALRSWGADTGRVWFLEDAFTGFRRLEAEDVAAGLTRRTVRRIRAGRYTDFHAVLPYAEWRELNERVVDVAAGAP